MKILSRKYVRYNKDMSKSIIIHKGHPSNGKLIGREALTSGSIVQAVLSS